MTTDAEAAAAAPSAPPAATPTAPDSEDTAATYESTHVHAVYEAIAPHFSATRHKPWPRVASFLDALPPGAVGLDIGCGNGKYLAVSPHLHLLGSDRSANLVALARDNTAGSGSPPKKASAKGSKGDVRPEPEVQAEAAPPTRRNEVLVADSLALPYRLSSVDFALSIAVLHHLSTPTRRRAAVRAILDTLLPTTGKALLFVWALEQRSSRRGWDAAAPQDQLVPWVTKANQPKRVEQEQPQEEKPDETWHRYYHLYKEGELDADVRAVGGVVLESGYERDNWWAICARGPDEK
ncbi:hypothetical protein ACHAQA_004421 [Verticillium albo-atrum]